MGRLGRYENNLMTWVSPTNCKLVDRATRYITHLLECAGRTEQRYEDIVLQLFTELEGVEPGESGWLVSPGSVDELAGALEALLATPAEQLAEMGARGAARVRERHDATAQVRLLAAQIERVALSRPS